MDLCLPFQGGDVRCEGRDDKKEFADIRSAMKVLMFSDKDVWSLLKILGALLHLGNLKYNCKPSCADPEGGYNGSGPPLESYMGFYIEIQHLDPPPWKMLDPSGSLDRLGPVSNVIFFLVKLIIFLR